MPIVLETTLESMDCIHCGMVFAVPVDWLKKKRQTHDSFYCPGCRRGMCFPGKSDVEKLRAQLVHQREISDARAEQIRRKDYQYRAAKGQLTKFKKRVGKGVCPCCNRHFKDLARHMETQHPDLIDGD